MNLFNYYHKAVLSEHWHLPNSVSKSHDILVTCIWRAQWRQLLQSVSFKPKLLVRNVDKTFVIWPHGPDRQQSFHHLFI